VEYQINLPVFEGPFDLLFHLIEKAEVDIYDISIAEITSQYLETLQSMRELNLDIASEFLVMAATLLRLKSRKLLPTVPAAAEADEDELFEIDTQEQLVERLLEYRYFREVAEQLRKCELAQKRVYVRSFSGETVALVNPDHEAALTNVTLSALLKALEKVLAEQKEPREIAPDDFSVEEKMEEISLTLRQEKQGVEFSSLFSTTAGISEIIVTFIALLELVRLGRIIVWQDGPMGRILLLPKLA